MSTENAAAPGFGADAGDRGRRFLKVKKHEEEGWLARLIEGSVADSVAHQATVPVLVVAAPPRQR